ncbi:MAG: MBL fold metallo-hydrolase, partial [Oscillospiraceae bacterium]|nr:MBL fold metallo-hydrolase [Oscillospiraceae bacterium]
MNYFTLTLGDYQTNTYLVYDEEKNCAVIDPGYEADTIWKKAEQEGLKIRAILLTHGHFDHVGAVKALAQKAVCPV